MKYIDSEKLIAEIKRWKELITKIECEANKKYCRGYADAIKDILHTIASLQKEQPEVDLVAELKHHLATTPKEQLEKEWKELEHWNNIGPTVQEFLYGKKSEVELDKEITNYYQRIKGNSLEDAFCTIAQHFYELGQRTKYQQDREEFAKLKAKEWQEGYEEGYEKGIARKEK